MPNDRDPSAIARKAMDELYERQTKGGFVNTCCYDFGVPAVVKVIEAERAESAQAIAELGAAETMYEQCCDGVPEMTDLAHDSLPDLAASIYDLANGLYGLIDAARAERDELRKEVERLNARVKQQDLDIDFLKDSA